MNSSDYNFEAALKQAKESFGYSNLSRCYVALAKKLEELEKAAKPKKGQNESSGPK